MAVRLTVYDGAGVIGGNKILLESGSSRLFFDFGTTYAVRERYFEEYLRPRANRGLLDLVTLDLLPPLLDLYRGDMQLGGLARERLSRRPGARELGPVDGVFLSHAHLDHSGYISFLREDVPVYCTGLSAAIAKAVQDTAPSDFEKEVCYQAPRQEKAGGVLESTRGASNRGRQYYTVDGPPSEPLARFWTQSPLKSKGLDCCPLLPAGERLGSLPGRAFPVDHSIYGAAACAVETEAGWVVYTGDLRLHGRQGESSRRFAEAARELHPALLVCEGTHVAAGRNTTEEEVHEHCLAAVRRAGQLVVADFGPRNVERLLIFRDIAARTGRRLAILARDAYLLDAMRYAEPAVSPRLYQSADAGTVSPRQYQWTDAGTMPDIAGDDALVVYRDLKSREGAWEAALRERYAGKLVDAGEVSAHQEDYIVCLSFWDMNELVDIDPRPGGLYVYSSSEAYSEEQRIDHRRLANWLGEFGLRLVGLRQGAGEPVDEEGFHASGHITGPDLLALIHTISPRTVLPVHTQQPEFFVENLRGECRVIVPTRGEAVEVG
ncbi:MAG: MBL fold metallo-hydrolase [Chloroflexi bacterium]|nr:MBL fold metallo-hydrolase [Chloroflexota bacterium]